METPQKEIVGGSVNVNELVGLVQKHKNDKNYQFRDWSWEQIDAAAKTSFDRITPDQKIQVMKVCAAYGLTDSKQIVRFRFMAQTNLFFLCKLLGTYKDVSDKEYVWTDGKVHNTHEEICNSFFVEKNPTFPSFKEFAAQYIDKKERLLLVPRGGYKSSMDMADCAQWVINFPEVTILVLCGVLALANDFVGEIKGHFTLEQGGSAGLFGKTPLRPRTMHSGTGSMFQVLFPEHCIAPDTGKSDEYQTPAVAVREKEGTVSAASIEQSLTGWHVCVLKLDDVVTNENSQTVDRMRNINKQVSINQAMLHPYGFYDKIGTWYDTEDTYGQDIKSSKKYAEDGEDFPMKIYIRAAWWATEDAIKQGKIADEMVETDYNYWFNDPTNASSLTFKFLNHKRKTDPWYAIKYLNDPTQMHVIKFPRELLVRRTINAVELPSTGMIVSCVDTAYSTKTWADYTVIITSLIYGGRFYIIDMKRGRYNEYELPAMIAATAQQWKPKRICIEETGAIKYIQREVYREMDKLKVRVPIELVPLGQGSKATSKKTKAGPVLRFLGDDRLRFINTCPFLEDLYDELSKFGTAASTHDDIVDALSILINQFSSYADIEGKMTASGAGFTSDQKMQNAHNLMHCDGKYGKLNQRNDVQLEFPDQSPQSLSRDAALDAYEASQDPLGELFG
jgi:predicted phage terminase large subunit-like protein